MTFPADMVIGTGHGELPVKRGRHGVEPYFMQDILCLVQPSHFKVASHQPYAGFPYHVFFPCEMAYYIRKSCRGLKECPLMKLRLAEQHPRVVYVRVEFFAVDESAVLRVAHLFRIALRLLFYRVKLYGLFAFFYGTFKIAGGLGLLFVSVCTDRVQMHQAGIVVLIIVLHPFKILLIGLVPVEMDIEARGKPLIKATGFRILFRGTRNCGDKQRRYRTYVDVSLFQVYVGTSAGLL